jgi:hypothetical protein
MKKFYLVLATAYIAALGFVGCKQAITPPQIVFGTGQSVSVNAGDSVKIAITITTKGKLKGVSFFTRDNSGSEELYGTPVVKFSNSSKYECVITLQNITETTVLIAEAVDTKNQTKKAECVLEVGGGKAMLYNDVELGFNYLKTVGSSFSVKTGIAPLLADAKLIPSEVDFMFFNGKINGVTITAPSDDLASQVFNNGVYGVQTWDNRNITTFVKYSGSFEGASLQDVKSQLNGADTHVNHLTAGDVVAFQTASGQIGVVQLAQVGPDAASTLNVNVKVLR